MRTKYQTLLALGAAVLFATSTLAAQAKPAAPPQSAPAAPAKFVPPIRGEAPVNMTKPVTKRLNEEVVTTFKVKNPSATNSIAGLKISGIYHTGDSGMFAAMVSRLYGLNVEDRDGQLHLSSPTGFGSAGVSQSQVRPISTGLVVVGSMPNLRAPMNRRKDSSLTRRLSSMRRHREFSCPEARGRSW